MKKLLLLCTGVLVAAAAHGQIFVSGLYNLSSSNYKSESPSLTQKTSETNVTFIPRFGFVFGNWIAGGDAGFSSITERSKVTPGTGDNKTVTTQTTIGPFVRYVRRPVEWLGLWGEFQTGIQFGAQRVNGDRYYRQNGFGAGLRPGVMFFLGKHLSFEASYGNLSFVTSKATYEDDSTSRDTYGGLELNNSTFLFGANWTF